ncbi:MAG: FAD-binding protein [Candidatus Protochlamydia sp.]|nr:FAD-binding protein [Candidatus Protochlamydia sp.]
MKTFELALKEHLNGTVHFDPITKRVYSVDASIFEVEPLGVALPASKEDLLFALRTAYAFKIPVTVRGAATGITGGCLGRGLIIDLSKSLTKLLEFDPQKKTVLCQPGIIQDDLNHLLFPYGLRLGPDTSTGNRATLGGMLANNAAGSRSLHYGKMVDHVIAVEIAQADGTLLQLGPLAQEEWNAKLALDNHEGHLYREVERIRNTYGAEIRLRFPAIPRRASGYNLDELVTEEPPNLAKIIAGSEGTLGIATQITMAVVPKIRFSGLCLIFFNDLLDAFRQVEKLLTYQPIALELIDDQIIELGRLSPSMRGELDWLQGKPKALLMLELAGNSENEVLSYLEKARTEIREAGIGYAHLCISDKARMEKVWKLRKSGLGILLSKRSYSRAIAFLEDISVAPENLAYFMSDFLQYLNSKGKSAGIYGHAGSGCMHVRPYINLQDPQEFALMRQMMEDVTALLVKYGGALSGEHGDGLIRSWLNPVLFGTHLTRAFKELKEAFDPFYLLNPGKIVPLSTEFEELRTIPGRSLASPQTFQNFKHEGGFALAADLCNGNGLCRKKENVMCPSFQATNDEFHSTRARAQALRGIMSGRLPLEDFTSHGMHAVMDLCISCKGCKTECPSQVDMAKMKSEFLYHYQEKHGYSLRTKLFASIGAANRWGSKFPSLFNAIGRFQIFKKGLGWMGIAPQRPLPLLAKQRFSTWFESYQQPGRLTREIVLLNDTFNEFNHPHIGQAAVHVLNALEFRVIVPEWSCCGRPALSKGVLALARKQAQGLLMQFEPYARLGMPILGLEPSCLLTIKDDYIGLLPPDDPLIPLLEKMKLHCFTFDEFLNQLIQRDEFKFPAKPIKRKVLVHGHCYQKALVGMQPTLNVLRAIQGLEVSEIPSGCCGMAGSFGYEKEHYAISMKIGELILLPAIRENSVETWIVASGTSCRQQIWDGAQRRAFHLAEALNLLCN